MSGPARVATSGTPHAGGPAVVLVTIAAGRHDHLRNQRRHLAVRAPGAPHVIVSMGDEAIADLVGDDPAVTVLDVPPTSGRLPLAEARNVGVREAIRRGAGLVVLLDVDCLPGPHLLERYAAAAERVDDAPALLCGPVTYLPAHADAPAPADLSKWTRPHPARPAPPDGLLGRGGDARLFWSLSFAVRPPTWELLGGFCTAYDGYGGEDTDLGLTAARRGVEIVWVGGAHAYHQHHPVSDPPVEHLDDILRNAETFHRRWGEWPMEGWLAAFERRGLIEFSRGRWRRPS